MSLHARAIRAVAGLIALVLVGVGLVLGDVSVQRSWADGAARTAGLLADSEALQAALADQEIALAAYDQTRSDKFLSPYFNARQKAAAIEQRMRRAAAIDSWARPPVDSLLQASDNWQAWADGQSENIQLAPSGPIQLPTTMATLFDRVRVQQSSFRDSVAVQRSNEGRQQSRAQVYLLAILGGDAIAAVIGLFVLGRLLLYGTLRPIGRLNEIASALAAGERVQIPELGRNDEVGSLARSLAAWDRSIRGRLALSEAMVEVSGEINLPQVLESSATKLTELMGADLVSFCLQDGRSLGQVWVYLAGVGLRDPVPADTLLADQSLASEALRTRQAVTGDVRSSGTWDSPITRFAKDAAWGPSWPYRWSAAVTWWVQWRWCVPPRTPRSRQTISRARRAWCRHWRPPSM
jgi:HAMP domain-containing protein